MKKIVFALLIGLGIGLASLTFASSLAGTFSWSGQNYTTGADGHVQVIGYDSCIVQSNGQNQLWIPCGNSNTNWYLIDNFVLVSSFPSLYTGMFSNVLNVVTSLLIIIIPIAILLFSISWALVYAVKIFDWFASPSAWDKEKKGYEDLCAETDRLIKGLK